MQYTFLKIILISSILLNSFSGYAQQDTLTYVFFGHIYQGGGPWGNEVDFRLETMDMSQFDGIWLGGDVGAEVALNESNFAYLDSIFDLDKPSTHWALGNHDTRNGNLEWIEKATQRPRFYAHSAHGLTVVVLDGNISPLDCENLNKQYNMIKNVCDTISSGHLVFLVHHGIAMGVPNVPDPINYSHNEAKNWLAHCYHDSATYANGIYPLLANVENKGVDVFHIMGDTGSWYKSFHGTSTHGVDYLAAGLGNGYKLQNGLPTHAPDMAIVFKHAIITNQLSWEFVKINDL